MDEMVWIVIGYLLVGVVLAGSLFGDSSFIVRILLAIGWLPLSLGAFLLYGLAGILKAIIQFFVGEK